MSDNEEEAEAEAESASCASAEDLVNDERSPKSAVIEIDFGRGRRGEVFVRRGDDAHALALQFVCDYGFKDSALSKVESHIRDTLAELSFISDRESEAEGCWALDVTMDSTTEQQLQNQQEEQPELVDLSAIAESETAASAAEMAAEAAEAAAAAAAAETEASLLSELASLYGELVRTRTEQASIASALASALQDAADMRARLEAAEKAALHSDESKAATLEIAALRRKVATLQMQLMQLTDKSRGGGGGGGGGGDDDDDGNSADAKRNELLSMIKNL